MDLLVYEGEESLGSLGVAEASLSFRGFVVQVAEVVVDAAGTMFFGCRVWGRFGPRRCDEAILVGVDDAQGEEVFDQRG